MKNTIYSVVTVVCLMFMQSAVLKADWNFDPKLRLNNSKDNSKEIIRKDYNKALKMKKIAAGLFGASIDFQIGYGTTSATVDQKSAGDVVKTESKGGFQVGAIVNVNLFNILNLTTGLDFTKKNFGITLPYTNPLLTGDSVVKSLSNSYLNIPMNVTFGGMVSDKVGFSFTGGPYIGLLLNAENAVSGFKDFDFGLNGMLTGKYYLNPFVAVLLGTKVQYGGLNNLLSSSSVEKLHTVNWGGFTGMSVGF